MKTIIREILLFSSVCGFRVFHFGPLFTDCLGGAKASIGSPCGTVFNSWQMEAGLLTFQVSIPGNFSGLVALSVGRVLTINGLKLNEKRYALVRTDGYGRF